MSITINFNLDVEGATGTKLSWEDDWGQYNFISNSGTKEGGEYYDYYVFTIEVVDEEEKLGECFFLLNGERHDLELNETETKTIPYKYMVKNNDILDFTGVIFRGTPPPIKQVSGFNYVYSVDRSILKSLASERFETFTSEDKSTFDVIDLGQYIINVLEIPFNIPSEMLDVEQSIILGHKILNTKAIEIINDELIINIGDIEVPHIYNNTYDYINTDINLYLPYATPISLDSDFIIGETISVNYIINLYSGDTTINVSSTKNEIVLSHNTKLGREIPFLNGQNNDIMFNNKNVYSLNNGIKQAFIEVSRNIPINNIYSNMISEYVQLKKLKGFINVEEIELKINGTLEEKQIIETLLKNGVYIK